MSRRAQNTQLADLLALAGWSLNDTAQHINTRAADLRHPGIAVDKSRVSRWISGERPRPPVGDILADVLGRHLGAQLTLGHLGWGTRSDDPLAPGWSADTMVESLQSFTGSDLMLDRRDILTLTLGASLSAATSGLWNHPPTAPAPAGRIESDTLDQLEGLVEHWRAADDSHGGALFRTAVVAQLHSITRVLGAQRDSAVTARLHLVAADLAGLAGWMSHDVGKFAAAQRYWSFGVLAARRAGEPGRAAELLSRFAHQMMHFGRPRDALELLDVANRAAGGEEHYRLRAMLTAQRGRMLAATGDGRAAQYRLSEAGDLLATAEQKREPAPGWIGYFDAAELAGATAVSRRDLAELHCRSIGPASVAFADAVALRSSRYRRCRAMDLVGQAAALLTEGDPQQACAVAHTALAEAGELDSALIGSRLLTLTGAAEPFCQHTDVVALRDCIRPWSGRVAIPAA